MIISAFSLISISFKAHIAHLVSELKLKLGFIFRNKTCSVLLMVLDVVVSRSACAPQQTGYVHVLSGLYCMEPRRASEDITTPSPPFCVVMKEVQNIAANGCLSWYFCCFALFFL